VAAAASAPSFYLFGRGLDLTFVAGGLTFLLFPLTLLAPNEWDRTTFLVLLLFCNYPHYMATLYRVYKSRTQIERYRMFSIYFTGLMAITAVAAHLIPAWWVYVLYTVYLVWSPYHYTGQNYGISVMYLRRGGVALGQGDRWLLYLACVGPFLGYAVFINMESVGGFNPMFLRLGIPFETGRTVFSLFALVGLASATAFLFGLRGRATAHATLPVVFLLASQTAWFSLLGALGVFRQELGLGTFRAEALVPAVAFLHCAQYLGVTAYYERREAAAEQRGVSFLQYAVALVLGGAFLWLGTSRFLASAFDLDYGLSFLIMTAIINLHHFVMDGAIWKLRDGRLARLLITPSTAAEAAAGNSDAREAAGGWHPAWRGTAWAAAGLAALLLGATDVSTRLTLQRGQRQQIGNHHAEARTTLEQVLKLNPRVGDAVSGVALADMNTGNVQRALEGWRRSVELNPLSAQAHTGLGESLMMTGRVDEAMPHLERAIRLDPRQAPAYLLLANAHAAKGDRVKASELAARARQVASAGIRPASAY
jgi:tetratricopeptide (TPR) repeat protein